jgi:plastocyanin
MRKHAIALCVLSVLTLAACGGGGTTGATATATATTAPTATATPTTPAGSGAATISMGAFGFSGTKDVTIKAGQAVTFNDPAAGGGIHNLVTGTNGMFKAEAGAPQEFATSTGVSFQPGTSMDITFPNAGTFTITCTIHPSMLATITVTK